jgi:hypothetical protein
MSHGVCNLEPTNVVYIYIYIYIYMDEIFTRDFAS